MPINIPLSRSNELLTLLPKAIPKSMLIWIGLLLALVPSLWMMSRGNFNTVAAILFISFLTCISIRDKQASIQICLAYLFLLGDIRRILNMTGDIPKFDPLLLVGPVFSIVLALPILLHLRLKDGLSKAVAALMVVMILEIFNPKQGPLAVGLAGAMFYLIPMLWFWLGRQYGSFQFLGSFIRWGIIPLAVLAAALGIFQTYVGFLPWEQSWIDNVASHLSALNLGGGFIRAFGYSVNGVEFVGILMAGCTACMALFFAGQRVYGFLVPMLAFAIFLSSSRTAVLNCLFGIAASWALSSKSGRGWALRLVVGLVMAFGVLAISVSKAAHTSDSTTATNSAASISAQHQIEGFAHPLDAKHSTAGIHSQMFLNGILKGITYPIGYGLGSATLASGKLGGDASASGSSEIDLSDVFSTMGIVGGSIYVLIFYLILRRSVWFGRSTPQVIGLPVLGILACMLGGWLGLGRYAMTPFIWFLVGSVSRHSTAWKTVGVQSTTPPISPAYRSSSRGHRTSL